MGTHSFRHLVSSSSISASINASVRNASGQFAQQGALGFSARVPRGGRRGSRLITAHVSQASIRHTIKEFERFTRIVRERVLDVLIEYGDKIKDHAKSIVPVDTGDLQRSLKVFVEEGAMTVTIFSDPESGQFHAEINYGLFVELGTRLMAAQPYIRPAYKKYERSLLTALRRAVCDPPHKR